MQREDDTEATVRERLAVYNEQTAPLIAHYSAQQGLKYVAIDGQGEVASIQAAIADALAD